MRAPSPHITSLLKAPPLRSQSQPCGTLNVSDSACFQLGVDALSIIIWGFAESWGLGNLPGCVKVSMRKASSCLQKRRQWRSSGRLECLFFVSGEGGPATLCFSVWENKPISNAQTLNCRGNNQKENYPITWGNQSTYVNCQKLTEAALHSVFFLFWGIRALCVPERQLVEI